MYKQEFIEKAIKGGWREQCRFVGFGKLEATDVAYFKSYDFEDTQEWSMPITGILLDPLAWQAVGKVEGWEEKMPAGRGWSYHDQDRATVMLLDIWECNMHSCMQALIEGKTIEQFLSTL